MDLLAAITSHPAPSQILLLSSAASHSSLCFRPAVAAAAAAAQRAVFQVSCSISQIHSYGTVDYERRPALKWSSLYRRIAKMTNPSLGPAAVIEQWEEQERKLLKWDFCRVVKELRKFRRFVLALETKSTDEGLRWVPCRGGSAVEEPELGFGGEGGTEPAAEPETTVFPLSLSLSSVVI